MRLALFFSWLEDFISCTCFDGTLTIPYCLLSGGLYTLDLRHLFGKRLSIYMLRMNRVCRKNLRMILDDPDLLISLCALKMAIIRRLYASRVIKISDKWQYALYKELKR